ncbi:MAG: MltA domain-containing protein [Alphaproteobacteria bacterium]|nr:MltA domain-containing protein [Alphaproteobacteria bacterium]
MFIRFICLFGGVILSACQSPVDKPHLEYSPSHFTALPGWNEDKTLEALPAIQRSCEVILKEDPNKVYWTRPDGNPGYALDWHPFCNAVKSYCVSSKKNDEAEWRALLKSYLIPYKLSLNGSSNGKFTGYYEPLLKGSMRRYGLYQTPLYKLPKEGTVNINIPRKDIVEGKLNGRELELVWVDDAIDAFFLQIQGSGRVLLDDGKMLRLGYAGTNKHRYHPIGKSLVGMGALKLQDASMQGIRNWLLTHPKEADAVMNENESYVFFRVLNEENPIGSQGVPLTPTRSMAVDPKFISLGTPIWINITHPDKNQGFLQHLIIAQDTGGAIKGGLRGDYFWGFGGQSAEYAGKMNSDGEYYVLLPKNLESLD